MDGQKLIRKMAEQRTIERVVKARGIGVYSGYITNMTLFPAPNNIGIVFIRKDVPGKLINAYSNTRVHKDGCKSFEDKGVKVITVEYLMDAFEELEIDNVLIELDSFEVPIMDGTDKPFKFLVWHACGAHELIKPKGLE